MIVDSLSTVNFGCATVDFDVTVVIVLLLLLLLLFNKAFMLLEVRTVDLDDAEAMVVFLLDDAADGEGV